MILAATSSLLLLAFAALSAANPEPAPPGITAAPVVKRQGTSGAGAVVHLDGIGQVFSATGEVSQGSTVIDGQTRPVFQVGGVFAPYNVSLGEISLVNILGGVLGLTYKTVDGVVLPDLTYNLYQDQTEHITIPGILTFSDGSGPGSVTVPQVFFSGDLYSGFTGAIGNGAISFELLGQTVVLTDTNGFAGNPTSGVEGGFSGAVIVDDITVGGSFGGEVGTKGIAGTAEGGIGPIATGNAAASLNAHAGLHAGGTILSILGVEGSLGVDGVCGGLSLIGIGEIGGCPQATPSESQLVRAASVTPTVTPAVSATVSASAGRNGDSIVKATPTARMVKERKMA